MKNVHVLATDKPSRLIKSQDDDFIFLNTNAPDWLKNNLKTTKQHIYITSDEKIKEGDYWINLKFKDVDKCTHRAEVLTFNSEKFQHVKKIILTTDDQLIKDGVQAITDEFLEWFVKNPSCERVEVNKIIWNIVNDFEYKIIIPKEEPKQETLEEVAEILTENAYQNEDWETGRLKRIGYYQGFINGAKWQQQRYQQMYSEEELQQEIDAHLDVAKDVLLKSHIKQIKNLYSEEELVRILGEFSKSCHSPIEEFEIHELLKKVKKK